MSTSDTHTTAASAALARLRNATSGSGNDPGTAGAPGADGSGLPAIAKSARAQPAPPAPSDPAAPGASRPLAEQVSDRIAHPVPRHHEDTPQDIDELLHPVQPQPASGPPFRHMDGQSGPGADTDSNPQADPGAPNDPAPHDKAVAEAAAIPPKPFAAPRLPAVPLGTAAASTPDGPAAPTGTREAPVVSGGFAPVNNWLDSLPEPEWHRIGDKIYASPTRFKTWLGRARDERARAAEARERTRLMDAAHAEALAEAAKRAEEEHAAKFRAEQELAEKQLLEAERQERLLEQKRLEQLRLTQQHLEQQRLEQQRLEMQRVDQARESNTVQPPDAALLAPTATPTPAPARTPASPEQLAALVASAKAAIDRQQALVEPFYVPPYTLPDTSPNPEATSQDTIRRILFTLAAVFMVVTSLFGIGDLVSGGDPDRRTMLSLAPAAYALVPVISFWSLAAAWYSWRPSQSSAVRQRAMGRTFPLALAASALWLVSVNAGSLFLAFCAAGLCLGLLLVTVRELNTHTSRSTVEHLLTDAPAGLMAGFFLVVTAASFAELLQSWNVSVFPAFFASVIVLGLGYVATSLARTERGRIALASGFAWGMLWLMMSRLVGPEKSVWVAVLAGMAGFVVLVATENLRYQISHAEHRAALGKRTEF